MELRVLKYFLTVAREENITKAASLLHLSQPTLSRQLQQLEDELGVQLFRRSSHHITLTEDGVLLRHRAAELIELADKIVEEFSSDAEPLVGNIVIGCAETYNMRTLAEWMAEFREKYPLVTFQVHSATADKILACLEEGRADFGLLMEPVDVARYEVIRLPRRERWGVMIRSDSLLADLRSIRPQDLIDTPLILPERLSVQSTLRKWFGNTFERQRVAATYNLLLNAIFMVEQRIGVAICYDFKENFPSTKFIPLEDMPEPGAVFVWKWQRNLSKVARRFMEHFTSRIK